MNLSDAYYLPCDRCREATKLPDPKTLCYYHKKIRKHLIDEPEFEYAYTELWVGQNYEQDYQSVLNQLVPKFYSSDHDQYEDCMQEMWLYFMECTKKYNEEKGVMFTTFAYIFLNDRLKNYAKKIALGKERTLYGADPDLELSDFDLESLMLAKEGSERIRKWVRKHVPKMDEVDQYIMRFYLLTDDRPTQSEIANRFDLTQQAIAKRLRNLYERLEAELC